MLFNKEEKETSKISLIATDTTRRHYTDASNWRIWTSLKHFFNLILMGDIDVASTYFVQCNFVEQKIDVILTYFLRRNFDGRKIDIFCTCFDLRNFDRQKHRCHFDVLTAWFRWTIMWRFFNLQLIGRLFLT